MSDHNTPVVDANNGDSCVDAKALVSLVFIVVVTACFWLLGQ
jgi:hypothetical protein